MPITIAGLGTLSDSEWALKGPQHDYHLIQELPNGGALFMGETPRDEDLRLLSPFVEERSSLVTTRLFDTRVDLYGYNLRAAEGVDEYVFRLGDSDIRRWRTREVQMLEDAVYFAFEALSRGKRVLVNCQAGLNRSGLVTALVMMAYGHTAEHAIHAIRSKRSVICLANETFENFLLNEGAAFAVEAVKEV